MPTLLTINPEPRFRLRIQRYFLDVLPRYNAQATVHACASLTEALAWLESNTPTALVVESILPDGEGTDLYRILRQKPEYSHTPIAFATDDDSTFRLVKIWRKTDKFVRHVYPQPNRKDLLEIAPFIAPSFQSASVLVPA